MSSQGSGAGKMESHGSLFIIGASFTMIQTISLTREQALRGALAWRWEKEGQHATTSLKFENLHRKSRCEMLIGRDDINNGVITLGARVF